MNYILEETWIYQEQFRNKIYQSNNLIDYLKEYLK